MLLRLHRCTNMQMDSFYSSSRLKPSERSCIVHSVRVPPWGRVFAAAVLIAFAGLPARSAQALDLTQKSLEDLMNVKVTSVSKREQKTSQAAAAVFVISRED